MMATELLDEASIKALRAPKLLSLFSFLTALQPQVSPPRPACLL